MTVGEDISVDSDLVGSESPLLYQVMLRWPHPVTEHVNTPLNGAAALVSVGWMRMWGAKGTWAINKISLLPFNSFHAAKSTIELVNNLWRISNNVHL